MKSIILLHLITTVLADKRNSVSYSYEPTTNSKAKMTYYTDIDQFGAIYIYFHMDIKNFYKKPKGQFDT